MCVGGGGVRERERMSEDRRGGGSVVVVVVVLVTRKTEMNRLNHFSLTASQPARESVTQSVKSVAAGRQAGKALYGR